MLKKIMSGTVKCLLFFGVLSFTACQSANDPPETNQAAQLETAVPDGDPPAPETEGLTMLQLTPLKKGEELAVMHTSMGDIKLRLFPDQAPKAVENFITHAKAGYYDGVIFHRVINDFMIQGGDPDGTGMGGESIWGEGFGNEFDMGLRHFRGALSMAHSSQPNSNGSQFFIVQNSHLDKSFVEYFQELRGKQNEALAEAESGRPVLVKDVFPKEALDEYLNNGGTPHLDFTFNQDGHTVFGQVVEGMDVVDAIAAVKIENVPASNSGYGRPVEDVVIESISFETY